MRNEANLGQHSTTSDSRDDRSNRPEFIDPDLYAIRAFIDLDDTVDTGGYAEPMQAERPQGAPNERMRASKWHRPKTSPARTLLSTTASFIKRPDAPRVLALLVLVTFIVLEPGFVVFLFVMSFLTLLVLYFSLGPDPFQNWAINRYKRLRDRDPDAAERLRLRAAKTSRKLSALIEKLPEKWTTGLYLPDFEEPQDLPETWNTDPFERLARQ